MRRLVIFSALMVSQVCHAQSGTVPQVQGGLRDGADGASGWSVTIGAAPVAAHAWQGSKDMAFSIFPDLRINYRDDLFASVPEGAGWNAINKGGWRAGPLAKLRFGRDERDGGSPFLIAGGSDALRGMGDVPATVELGGFVQKRFGRQEEWQLRGEVRRAIAGHDGLVADLSASYRLRAGHASIAFGPRASLADDKFMRTYFGIDGEQSQRTGLAHYNPSGGFVSYGMGASVVRPLDRRSVLTLFGSIDRIVNPAGNSPLVRERGRRMQISVGLGYGFRFVL